MTMINCEDERGFFNIATLLSIVEHLKEVYSNFIPVSINFSKRETSDGIHVTSYGNQYEVYTVENGRVLNSKIVLSEEDYCSEVLRLCGHPM